MAEDRAIEALLEGCKSGNVYSGWTTMHALLQRRYLSSNSSGNEKSACEFIMRAFKTAVQPYLAAEIAAKLCYSLLDVLRHHKKPLGDSFSKPLLMEMNSLFKSVVSDCLNSSKQIIHEDSNDEFSSDVVPEVRTIDKLVPWFNTHLSFCESIVFQLYQGENLAGAHGACDTTDSSALQDPCSVQTNIVRWGAEAFGAAFHLAWYLSKTQRITESNASSTQSNANEIRSSAVHSWTPSKAWLRAMKWSIYGEKTSVREFQAKCLWENLWRCLLSPREQQWFLATFVYDVLCRSDVFQKQTLRSASERRELCGNVTKTMGAGDKSWEGYPPISATEAIEISRFALENAIAKMEKDPQGNNDLQVSIGGNFKPGKKPMAEYKEWYIFLECFVSIISANVSEKCCRASYIESCSVDDNEHHPYKKLYQGLCNFFSGCLKELPFLDWEAVAATYA